MKSILVYRITKENQKIVDCGNNYKIISREEFAGVLRSKHIRENLLEQNIVHMNWVPVLLETEEDIEFAVRKKQVVLLEGSLESPTSFSVFTLPYSVPNGNTRVSIDIFAKEKEAVKKHVLHQMMLFAQRAKDEASEGETFVSIVVTQDTVEAAVEAISCLGFEKYKFVYGSQMRDVVNMYIYQKQV